MPTLLFKKKYHDLIRSGKKTQTIRLWEKCWIKEGRDYRVYNLGVLHVTRIDHIPVSELTERDAKLDGFESLEKLLDEIRKIYDEKSLAGRKCYRVRFRYLGKSKK
ncbi:MAG: ASCH domain-containing protein [Planctomycetota bacterium]